MITSFPVRIPTKKSLVVFDGRAELVCAENILCSCVCARTTTTVCHKGEQYRRLVYLEHLADHFENELWYIQHLHSVLEGLLDGLPSAFSRAVMVQQEVGAHVHEQRTVQKPVSR